MKKSSGKGTIFKSGKRALGLKMRRIVMLGLLAVGSLIYAASCSTIGLAERNAPPRATAKHAAARSIEVRVADDTNPGALITAQLVKTALELLQVEQPWVIETLARNNMHVNLAELFNANGSFSTKEPDRITIDSRFAETKESMRGQMLAERIHGSFEQYLVRMMMNTIAHETQHARQYGAGMFELAERMKPSNCTLFCNYMELEAHIIGCIAENSNKERERAKTREGRDKLLDSIGLSWMYQSFGFYMRNNYARTSLAAGECTRNGRDFALSAHAAAKRSAASSVYGADCFSDKVIEDALDLMESWTPEQYAERLLHLDQRAFADIQTGDNLQPNRGRE
ncbi:MAG: hypothetical protein LBL52_00625 [Rickettsiales bacterium]|jgi:hypothetical protein|nr:hypothetical protein [Rickettsiales bacterium]